MLPENPLTFVNQPAGQGASVPDGRIAAHFAYWFEVKTTAGTLHRNQLLTHLKSLDSTGGDERLFVITPDGGQPRAIDDVRDRRVMWFSFAALNEAINAALTDPRGVVSEQARFLLRELQALLSQEGLIDFDDVVIVAARDVYPEYHEQAAYVCQHERTSPCWRTGRGATARPIRSSSFRRRMTRRP